MTINSTFDIETNEKTAGFTQQHNIKYKGYLDVLKAEFQRNYTDNDDNPVKKSVEDFDVVRPLGVGAFGVVFLVRDTTTITYHAMKVLEKNQIVSKKNVKNIHTEKNILRSVNFPFLVSLDFSCKDNLYVYLVLPFAAGGELFVLMRKFGTLSEPLAIFYATQVVLGLEYIHHCGAIHRDIKAENVLICESGYIKITDFGFSKVTKTRAWTLCGTPEYLAPEIILSKGYSYGVDWWALGVLIFEMSAGYPPFYHTDPMKLYDKILNGRFKTPDSVASHCKSLIKGFLEIEPSKRLGALKSGVYDIKSHSYFKDIDWDAILHQRVIPPYKPVCINPGDTNNFPEMQEVRIKKGSKCLFAKEFENF